MGDSEQEEMPVMWTLEIAKSANMVHGIQFQKR